MITLIIIGSIVGYIIIGIIASALVERFSNDDSIRGIIIALWPMVVIAVLIGRLFGGINWCAIKLASKLKKKPKTPSADRPITLSMFNDLQGRIHQVMYTSSLPVQTSGPQDDSERELYSEEVRAGLSAGHRGNIVIRDSNTGQTEFIQSPWGPNPDVLPGGRHPSGRITRESDLEKDTTLAEPEETETEPEEYDIIL